MILTLSGKEGYEPPVSIFVVEGIVTDVMPEQPKKAFCTHAQQSRAVREYGAGYTHTHVLLAYSSGHAHIAAAAPPPRASAVPPILCGTTEETASLRRRSPL